MNKRIPLPRLRILLASIILMMGQSIFAQSVNQTIDVGAHRGDRVNYRENSLSALRAAVGSGASSIEFDVHLTKDGVPVIYHDYFLNPKDFIGMDVPVLIKGLTFEQLKTFKYNQQKKSLYQNETVATLEEFFRLLLKMDNKRAGKVILHLELKSEMGHLEESMPIDQLVTQTLDVIKKSKIKNKIIARSFNWDVIGLLKERMPDMPRILLVDDNQFKNIDVAAAVEKYKPTQVAPNFRDVTTETVAQWSNFGVGVSPWTVNEEKDMAKLIEMGVVGFATDDPRSAVRFVKNIGLKIGTPFICSESLSTLSTGGGL